MDNKNVLFRLLSEACEHPSDWDDHADWLMFALNTSFDATRLDTPFYLVHGWDAQGTVSSMLGPKPSSLPERTAYEWRRKFQRDYGYVRACAWELQKKAKRLRSEAQTQKWRELSERLSRKLAHLWHGPFRIDEDEVEDRRNWVSHEALGARKSSESQGIIPEETYR
ncbi:hypothetical protein PHMEG_00026406 [Phytophthora megakarya]|uniref:Reverse transcriptase n=1 Tax=Phytophthora megakarya TaxID=4795 RepID=A0A225V9S9_9STRA|nr:hypothetical protein PHMEG_00026406 [Phytophthora megakarya]